jgi:hypothetical protein
MHAFLLSIWALVALVLVPAAAPDLALAEEANADAVVSTDLGEDSTNERPPLVLVEEETEDFEDGEGETKAEESPDSGFGDSSLSTAAHHCDHERVSAATRELDDHSARGPPTSATRTRA